MTQPAERTRPLPADGTDDRSVPPPGECQLWSVPVAPHQDWLDLLDQRERRRFEELPVAAGRHIFLTSRATQRLVGSWYLGIPPAEITIDRDCAHCGATHGRPRLRGATADGATIDYSVSHTQDWLFLAVTGSGLVGVDIEPLASVRDVDSLAAVTLTAEEKTRFHRQPAPARRSWLVSAWTRKEAAMKLTGLGLRAAPNQLDVHGPTVSVGTVPRWPAEEIHLYPLDAPSGHVAALASTVPLTTVRGRTLPGAE